MMARTVAAFIDRDVGELDSLGRRFARVPVVRALDAAATRELFMRAMMGRAAILRLELASADGEEIAALDAGELGLDSVEWAAERAARATIARSMPLVAGHHVQLCRCSGYPVRDDSGRRQSARSGCSSISSRCRTPSTPFGWPTGRW